MAKDRSERSGADQQPATQPQLFVGHACLAYIPYALCTFIYIFLYVLMHLLLLFF